MDGFVLGPLGPIIIAALATLGSIVGVIYVTKRLSDLGVGNAHQKIETNLRDLAATWEEKYAMEKTDHAETKRKLGYSQDTVDDLRRRLDVIYAERYGGKKPVERRETPG